jgi:hypothetical protein
LAVALSVGAVIALLSLLVFCGYRYRWKWIGVSERKYARGDIEELVPDKSLWDWLQSLIVPIGLILGVLLYNGLQDSRQRALESRRAEAEHALSVDTQREQALQSYLDEMTALILDRRLQSEPKDEVRTIARTHTLTLLRRLDPERKGIVLQFLYDSNLILKSMVIWMASADLRDADLREAYLRNANLSNANLEGADLRGAFLSFSNLSAANLSNANLGGAILDSAALFDAHLRGADLRGAILDGADLHEADFSEANLRGAGLRNAYLSEADLDGAGLYDADLQGANLRRAKLSDADLRTANLRGADLSEARFDPDHPPKLEGAQANRETIWPEGLNPAEEGVRTVD